MTAVQPSLSPYVSDRYQPDVWRPWALRRSALAENCHRRVIQVALVPSVREEPESAEQPLLMGSQARESGEKDFLC